MSQEEIVSKVKEAIEEDPQKNVFRSVSLFGSFLHGDFTEKSDIDLLVELQKRIGLLALMDIQNRIEDKVGQPVQMMTKNDISRFFREGVVKEAKRIY